MDASLSEIDILRRLALATAVGLLFGIQRGWQLRGEKAGQRVAGIRTFTLIGLCGGVCGLLAGETGLLMLGLAFFGFAVAFALFELRASGQTGNVSATNLVTGLLTFALGAYGARGSVMATGAAAVMAALVLAERHALHGLLRRITWPELRAALLLLVMTVVLLPVLPNRTVDPWEAVNPYEIWLMTVLIAGVSFGGYVTMRLSGERRGLLYAGAMGGLVTSTTVTWTFARLVREHSDMLRQVGAAILAAWIVSLLRVTVVALVLAPGLVPALLPPVAAAAATLLVPAIACFVWGGSSKREGKLPLRNPFELGEVLKFSLLLTIIMLCTKAATLWFGNAGVSVLGALSGIMDVDPITLSMARDVQGGAAPAFAASVILLANLTNAAAKAVIGAAFGGLPLGLLLGISMIAAAAAGGLAFIVL
ncbi:MAG TPA: DUF4010 domain-containing protein [Rhizomicrobium sp.]|nr:DUF4010 domain-containing protein [Rhizomicrobium sp.]